jgi:hypothetical protein
MTRPILFAGPDARGATHLIYGLADPREPERIRYVGRTNNAGARYREHLTRCGSIRGQWVAEIRERGEYPLMVLLEQLEPGDDPKKKERDWIRHFRRNQQADINDRSPWLDAVRAAKASR